MAAAGKQRFASLSCFGLDNNDPDHCAEKTAAVCAPRPGVHFNKVLYWLRQDDDLLSLDLEMHLTRKLKCFQCHR